MNLADYTTPAEIRALLGVDDSELTDAALAVPAWTTLLQFKLDDISPLVEQQFDIIRAITPEVNRTPAQQRFYLITKLYAAYVVAEDLLTSITMYALKRETDGKAEGERWDFDPEVREGIIRGVANVRLRLVQALLALNVGFTQVAAVVRIPMMAVGLATNPVTNSVV